jgi:hypothetical protein
VQEVDEAGDREGFHAKGIHGKLASGDRKGTRWNAEAFDGESVDNPGLGHGFR